MMVSVAAREGSESAIASPHFFSVFLPETHIGVQPAPSTDNISQSELHLKQPAAWLMHRRVLWDQMYSNSTDANRQEQELKG